MFAARLIGDEVDEQLGALTKSPKPGANDGDAAEVTAQPAEPTEQLFESLVILAGDPGGDGNTGGVAWLGAHAS